jgi:hypothetical protein
MADIDVQRKRGMGSAWLGVLLVILIALAAWGLWAYFSGEDDVEAAAAPAVPMAEPVAAMPAEPLVPTAVVVIDPVQVEEAMSAYTAHVETQAPVNGEHLYSAVGVSRMGAVLAAIVGREPGPNPEVVAKANAFYLIANLLVASPDTLRLHADWMHRTALAAVDAMEELGTTRFPDAAGLDGELAQARQAANAIRPAEGLMEQREEVRQFFGEAGDALRILAEQASAGTRDA